MARIAPLVALIWLAGCGGGDPSLSGRVSYNGTPIDEGAITFSPAGAGGKKVGARIYDGQYAIDAAAGLTPGGYGVTVNWDKKTGKRVSTGGEAMRDETKEGLPAKYTTTSGLTADLKAGANVVNFELPP